RLSRCALQHLGEASAGFHLSLATGSGPARLQATHVLCGSGQRCCQASAPRAERGGKGSDPFGESWCAPVELGKD
ncbi:unnamed protein product, partial [Effrenium voratum]